ncbi:MAG: hypothetical protein A7315_12100 [Candidatus Altiarchaeales archaeon WOR_SM1_79]|nr:MAG: hypothetical protein A7315_12100 [Candidatus Altiarchaeales archaeon WOR_SM1_79]
MEAVTVETIHQDIAGLQDDIKLIKNILLEEYELSEETLMKLEEARKVPDSELIDHEEVKKRFLTK